MTNGSRLEGSLSKKKLAGAVGAGAVLWAIGYALAMILFAFMPAAVIGWIVLPVMIPVTVYVSFARLKKNATSVSYVLFVALTWTVIAVAFDYVFLVSAFNVQNYYDFDVLLYYALTFLIPAIVGIKRR